MNLLNLLCLGSCNRSSSNIWNTVILIIFPLFKRIRPRIRKITTYIKRIQVSNISSPSSKGFVLESEKSSPTSKGLKLATYLPPLQKDLSSNHKNHHLHQKDSSQQHIFPLFKRIRLESQKSSPTSKGLKLATYLLPLQKDSSSNQKNHHLHQKDSSQQH